VAALAISPDGSRLALATNDRLVFRAVAEGRIGPEIASARIEGARFGAVTYSVDGLRAVVADRRGRVHAVDARDGTIMTTAVASEPLALAFAPQGTALAVATREGVELRDARSLAKIAARPMTAYRLNFSPDGATLYVRTEAGEGHPVSCLPVPLLAPAPSLDADEHQDLASDALSLSADGAYAASIVRDHLVLWKLPAATPTEDLFDIEDDAAFTVAFSPSDARVFAAPVQGWYEARHALGPQLYLWRIVTDGSKR
jgi:hypothetical protein